MSKMGSHDPFGHLKHKLWPKEGPEVKLPIWQFDSRPLKVKNRLILLRASGMRHIIGKLTTRATIFLYNSFQLKVCTQSYGPPKLRKTQFWEFWDSHLGIPRQK
jgi:hypothetical protein